MGPKKAKGGKGKGGKSKKKDKTASAEAGQTEAQRESEIERQELVKQAKLLLEMTKKEESSFNEFQQQREKINYFWIVEKKNLEDRKAELRNKERERQDLEEKHQVEIKIYKQRVKHLLYEHQQQVTLAKKQLEQTLQTSQDEYRDEERELKYDKRQLKFDLKEMELSHEDYLKSLKQDHDKRITLLRQEFERNAKEIQQKYDRKRKAIRDELESKRKNDTLKIEDTKNAHIAQLMNAHEKAFSEIKNYYNDITHNNLDLIKSLKEEVVEMKKKEAQDEKLMFEISQENKRMSEPLKKALGDVEKLRALIELYAQEKKELQRAKAQLLVLEKDFGVASWEYEVFYQRFVQISMELHDLQHQFQTSLRQVNQRNGFRNLLLEKKLGCMGNLLEQKDAELNELLVHAKLDANVLERIKARLENILESKNETTKQLEQELSQVLQLQKQLVQQVEVKLSEYGLPVDELGFSTKHSLVAGKSKMNPVHHHHGEPFKPMSTTVASKAGASPIKPNQVSPMVAAALVSSSASELTKSAIKLPSKAPALLPQVKGS